MVRGLWVAVLALVLTTGPGALGTVEGPSWTGRLSVVGNMPFSYLALTEASGHQWKLTGDAVPQLLKEGQGRLVRVTGQGRPGNVILVATWAWVPEEHKD